MESENQTPFLEEGMNSQQTVRWRPGNDRHPKERALPTDHFYIDKYWRVDWLAGLFPWLRVTNMLPELCLCQLHQGSDCKWKIPDRKPVGDHVNPRNQGRNQRGYRMVASNGDSGLSENLNRVEFSQSVIYQVRILLGERCDGTINTLYADLKARTCDFHKLLHVGAVASSGSRAQVPGQ